MRKAILLSIIFSIIAVSCRNSSETSTSSGDLEYAKGLIITDYKNYTEVIVKNPWEAGDILQRYILINKDSAIPENLPKATIVKVPLSNVLVYSDVYAHLIDELGSVQSISSVCDAAYYKTPAIVSGLSSGSITDCGSSMAPVVEKIISTAPEAIILSPFQNAGYGALESLGIPIIEMADYMEDSPLGRAEWAKFIGLLFGEREKSELIFKSVVNEYNNLLKLTSVITARPKVLSEYIINGVWYVPGGKSYKALLFKDAGAYYPWEDNNSSGSLQLDFTKVLNIAKDADFWLVSTIGNDLNKDNFLQLYPHNNQFEAYSKGNIFYANTNKSNLFEETAFHPNLLLKEYIKIFHSDLLPDYSLRYYKQIDD